MSGAAGIFEHISDAALRLQRMPKLPVDRNLVSVAALDPGDFQECRIDQFRHNRLHHSLGNPHQHCNFTQRDLRGAAETQSHMGGICQKRPAGCLRLQRVLRNRYRSPGIRFFSFSSTLLLCSNSNSDTQDTNCISCLVIRKTVGVFQCWMFSGLICVRH